MPRRIDGAGSVVSSSGPNCRASAIIGASVARPDQIDDYDRLGQPIQCSDSLAALRTDEAPLVAATICGHGYVVGNVG
jgi:hypothetical protein